MTQEGPTRKDEWAARGDALARRLAQQRSRHPRQDGEDVDRREGGMSGLSEGLKVASEFIGGILVGAALGWGFDKLFSTSPFGLIVFLLIGFAAGVLNVIRGVTGPSATPGPQTGSGNAGDERRDAP